MPTATTKPSSAIFTAQGGELELGLAATKIAPVFGPVVRGWRKALSDYDETELALILDF